MKKQTGSYYTPEKLSNFIVQYLESHIENNSNVLEPSVGDGSFISALNNLKKSKSFSLTVIDSNVLELEKATQKASLNSQYIDITSIHDDYLNFYTYNTQKYSLIIGNPPYIKSNLLKKKQLSQCQEIHTDAGLMRKKVNNIWTSFVIGACKSLEDDGILSFILPTDLLQVKYAEEIRHFLETNFERIEIFTLDKYIFSNIEQHTMILFAYKKHTEKGTYFYKITDFQDNTYTQISSNGLMINESKWTHYILDQNEITLLNKINKQLLRVDDFITSRPGVVTGANNYFILTKEQVDSFQLQEYVVPIIQKALFVNTNIELTTKHIETLINSNKPMFLLHLTEDTKIIKNLTQYFELGVSQEIHKRYKCSKRTNWYCIPNPSSPASGFIFKRYHKVPKMLKNTANVHVTDGAYKIQMKSEYQFESFIYSFFNIITLIFAEHTGRKYGGGVMELVPTEFRNLPIFYTEVSSKEFEKFRDNFNCSTTFNNEIFKYLQLSKQEIISLNNIYSKLLEERMS